MLLSSRGIVPYLAQGSCAFLLCVIVLIVLSGDRYCRQCLLGGNYGLLNRSTYEPNPDYYIARLFHAVMGDTVLEPPNGTFIGKGYLRPYMNCNRQGAGVALLLLNIAPNTTFEVSFAGQSVLPRDEYVFTAEALDSQLISLNGAELVVQDGQIPALNPKTETAAGTITMPPHSIGFFVLKDFPAAACAAA